MKKIYEKAILEVVILSEDIVRTSQNDNIGDMPEFPEEF
jgi:hypothetical protein